MESRYYENVTVVTTDVSARLQFSRTNPEEDGIEIFLPLIRAKSLYLILQKHIAMAEDHLGRIPVPSALLEQLGIPPGAEL